MFSLLLSLACAQTPSPARVSLVFGGDVIPHDPVKFVARMHDRRDEAGHSTNHAGWDHVFGPLAPVLKRHDVAVVNLETPIVTLASPEAGEMLFSAPPQMLQGLRQAGVTVATFANNHCLDQHREGIITTRAFLQQAGLLTAGAAATEAEAWAPLLLERRGVKIALLAVTRWLNGSHNTRDPKKPHVPAVPYPSEPIIGGHSTAQLTAVVSELQTVADAVIVLIHWGNEYQATPTPDDRALAKGLIEAGAAAVIGTHPHVLQPVEWVERRDASRGLVAFSLGNLVSNQDFDDAAGRRRDSVLLELTVEKVAGARAQLSVHGVPVATENRLGGGKLRNVQPVLLDDEISDIDHRLSQLNDLPAEQVKLERLALLKKRSLAAQRLERIHAVLGPAGSAEARQDAPPPVGQR